MSYAYKAILQCGHQADIVTEHTHGAGYQGHHTFCEECRLNMAVLGAVPVQPAEATYTITAPIAAVTSITFEGQEGTVVLTAADGDFTAVNDPAAAIRALVGALEEISPAPAADPEPEAVAFAQAAGADDDQQPDQQPEPAAPEPAAETETKPEE